MVKPYTPERGDVIWVSFDPSLGHEQRGKRPALVLSPASYHKKSSLLIACPITSHVKGYPFEVAIQAGTIDGVVLSDQIKSLDWRRRRISFAAQTHQATLQQVTDMLDLLLK